MGSTPAGASPYGVMDMAGNVWEWVNDWWQSDYYSNSPGNNPTGPTSGTYKVLHGGSWNDRAELLRVASRIYGRPTDRDLIVGFRCGAPLGVINQPPNLPTIQTPSNGATAQNLTSTLSWTGGDPDGDGVTYDVYFGTANPPTAKVANHQAILTYNPGMLAAETPYYWQIVAWDEHGLSTAGLVWNFTTRSVVIPGEMVLIPAGSFQMGCDPAHNGSYSCAPEELPLHTITLDAYRIDKYEVTNAQYAQCVTAGNCTPPVPTSSYNLPSYYGNPTYASYPVIYVDWNQSAAYCAWAGKRLPTEAEWEKAARGPTVRIFPWGDDPATCSLANFYNETTGNYCVGDTSAVGSTPAGASPYGVMDMAGNVWEWVNDWYQSDYYSNSPGNNPTGPTSGQYRVLRGGSWNYYSGDVRSSYRDRIVPDYRFNYGGFRCGR